MKGCKFLGLLLMVLLNGCGNVPNQSITSNFENQSYIVNGEIPDINQTNAVTLSTVAITTKKHLKNNLSFCTGTIIRKNVIMTAAHCINEYNAKNYIVAFGRTVKEASENGNHVNVIKAKVHEKYYSAKYGSDISLLLLESDIPNGYEPALINEDNIDVNSKFVIAGFGVTKYGNSQFDTGVLRQAHVGFDSIYNENQIALTGSNGEDTCQGDSGGPAYLVSSSKMYVAGITSWGYGCGVKGYYTNVKLFKDWIVDTIEELQLELQ